MIPQSAIDTVRASNGADSVPGDGETAPYGYTLVGSIQQLQRIAERMDEYGLTFGDLSESKQSDFEQAHEALQWHVAEMSNCLADCFVSTDDSIELPNGNSVDLPKQVSQAATSKDLPDTPARS